MPIYEYQCETCGRVFEYQQKITDQALTTCPVEICQNEEHRGKGKVHRMISKNVGLIFKGDGFYLTDYARKRSSIAESEVKESIPQNGSSNTQSIAKTT
ncbi:MAG: FmdB family zinc ribbon protein [Candidatus Kapaibacteriales bacterium]